MANVTVPGRFFYPRFDPTAYNMNNPGTSQTLDAAGDYMAFVFTIPRTGTLNTVHINQSQQTTIEDLRISFQDLDAIEEPDGTEDQFRVYTPVGGDLNNYVSVGLITSDGTDIGTKRSVTQGDRMGVVIRFNSAVGDIDILSGATKDGTKDKTAPHALFSTDSGTNWAIHSDWPTLMLEYETDGIVHIPDSLPLKTRNTVTMGNASTPDEVGFKFQVPFECRVVGVELGAASTDTLVGIENGAGGTIATEVRAFYDDDTLATGRKSFYFEEAEVTLAADTDYYVTWRPTTATTRTIYTWNIEDAAARAGLAWGTTSSYNTRTDGGGWTEDQTITMLMTLIISGIDDGAGAGPAGDTIIPRIQMAGDSGPIPVY